MLRLVLLIGCLSPALVCAQGLPWERLQSLGEASLKFLFWPVYDATLYGPAEAFSFPDTRPFALALEYRRPFTGKALVEETRRQWRAIGIHEKESWVYMLDDILTDVGKGDKITLYIDGVGFSHFYFNQRYLGGIEDPIFTEQFAAIWLSEKSTRPVFRDRLLGREK